MLYDTCLTCRAGESAGTGSRAQVAITEALDGGMTHHHHTVSCEDCGAWWFDDVVIGGLGLPVPARRDTVLCGCPDDGASRYTMGIILVPVPEPECHCTASLAEEHAWVRYSPRP